MGMGYDIDGPLLHTYMHKNCDFAFKMEKSIFDQVVEYYAFPWDILGMQLKLGYNQV